MMNMQPESDNEQKALPLPPPMPPMPVKQGLVYEKNALHLVFALISALLGYLLIKIGLYGSLGLGLTLWVVLLLATTFAWLRAKEIKVTKAGLAYFSLPALLGIYFSVSDNTDLKYLALLLLPLVYCYAFFVAAGRRQARELDHRFVRDMAEAVLVLPFTGFPASPAILGGSLKNIRRLKKFWYFLLGLVLMLPFLFIVLSLLHFDAAFQNVLSALPAFYHINPDEISRWIFGFFISFFLFGLLYQAIYRKQAALPQSTVNSNFLPGSVALGAVLPLLCIYLLFFFSQLTYFVSAFHGVLPVEFTYAEYARSGFFELCAVSGLNAGFLTLLFLVIKKEDRNRLPCRISLSLLSISSVVLILISLQKMRMYIGIYSLTPLRVYTSWFMLFLVIAFGAATVKTWLQKLNILKILVISLISMFLILCYADTDRLVATYNANQYETGTTATLDAETMDKLGASATPVLIQAQKIHYNETTQRELEHRYATASQDFRDWNFSAWRAEVKLREYFEQ